MCVNFWNNTKTKSTDSNRKWKRRMWMREGTTTHPWELWMDIFQTVQITVFNPLENPFIEDIS